MKRLQGLLVLSLLASACAEKPTIEVIEAQQRLAAARDAEADLYAPEEFDLAVSNLENAIAAIEEQEQVRPWDRSYTLAYDLLELSVEQSQAAIDIADTIRFEASFQAELLLPEVQITIDQAFAELERARDANVVSRGQIDELDADLRYSAQLLDDARESFDREDYAEALAEAEQAIDLAESVRVRSEEINLYAIEIELELQQ